MQKNDTILIEKIGDIYAVKAEWKFNDETRTEDICIFQEKQELFAWLNKHFD